MQFIKNMMLTIVVALMSVSAYAVQVNINTATATELAQGIDGVGSNKAQAIVEYRTEHGDFTNVDQLQQVKGIGEKIVLKNFERLSVSDSADS